MLWAVVAPAVLTVLILALSARPWKKGSTPMWSLPLALAVGFALSYIGVVGRPAFPPRAAQAWLVYLAPVAFALALVQTVAPKSRQFVAGASVLTLIAIPWLFLRTRVGVGEKEYLISLVGIAMAMVIVWIGVEQLSRRVAGVPVPVALTMTAIVASMALMNAHTRDFALLAGSTVTVLATAIVLAWWRKMVPSGGLVLSFSILILGLLAGGYFYADLTIPHAALIAAAPLAAWAGQLPGIRTRQRLSITVSAVAVLIVLAFVVVPTVRGLHETYKEQTESTYY
jgi:hypothetical protein